MQAGSAIILWYIVQVPWHPTHPCSLIRQLGFGCRVTWGIGKVEGQVGHGQRDAELLRGSAAAAAQQAQQVACRQAARQPNPKPACATDQQQGLHGLRGCWMAAALQDALSTKPPLP